MRKWVGGLWEQFTTLWEIMMIFFLWVFRAKRRNLGAFSQGSGEAGPSGTIPKSSESSAYKRVGSNVHRLHENKDSDDETNTWNGNSTQQQ